MGGPQPGYDADLDIDPATLMPEAAFVAGRESEEIDNRDAPAVAVIDGAMVPALAEILPADFKLSTLLTFLPDVRLKQALDALAADALAVAVSGEAGVRAADAALPALRDGVKEILLRFDGTVDAPGPTALAYALHKRLTGLRGEFVKDAEDAIKTVGQRIYVEQKRLDAVAAEERRATQAAADREARAALDRAAEEAARNQAPAPIVEALREQAKTATAPPVASRGAPPLRNTATVAKWRTRFVGTPADSLNPQPKTTELTAQQQEMCLRVLDGIRNGTVPLAAIQIDWAYLDRRAVKEMTTLAIPGIEAYDEGGVRSKRR